MEDLFRSMKNMFFRINIFRYGFEKTGELYFILIWTHRKCLF